MHHLNRLREYFECLQNQRFEHQTLTAKRTFLMQQAAYVTEADAAGPSITNHPLNTLTQRYSAYKRAKNECANTKEALAAMQTLCQQQVGAYQTCMEAIGSNKIADSTQFMAGILGNFKTMASPHAFAMVKEFLDNSAQTAIYLQSCQLSGRLDELVERSIECAQHALDATNDYGAVARYHPPTLLTNHRLSKWAKWCERLADHPVLNDCRDLAAQVQEALGKNPLSNRLVEQVMAFSYQMQTHICDSDGRLQKCVERMRALTGEPIDNVADTRIVQKYTAAFEDARKSFRLFLNDSPTKKQTNVFALHCVAVSTLCDLNKRLMMMENAAANAGENMVDLTFNGNWVLDELYAHSSIMCEIVLIVESAHRDQATNVLSREFADAQQCLRQIQLLHESVRYANEQFSATVLTNALFGVISENEGVLGVVTGLSSFEKFMAATLEELNLSLRCSGLLDRVECPDETTNVDILRHKYNLLKDEADRRFGYNVGGKLFRHMNKLFEQLEHKYDQLVEYVQLLSLRNDRGKIDQVKASLELTVCAFFGL